jgi:hypothetical protein
MRLGQGGIMYTFDKEVTMTATELQTKRGTSVFGDKIGGAVKFHDTIIVDWNVAEITLNTGGFQTPSTRRRMNQVAEVSDLGFHVYQDAYALYCSYRGDNYKFRDNRLTLRRVP